MVPWIIFFSLAGDAPNAWRAAYQDGLEPKRFAVLMLDGPMSGKSGSCGILKCWKGLSGFEMLRSGHA